jgi:oxalate decarboxylase/phosphoglucose isomerase-like protein (cupin superfamily)
LRDLRVRPGWWVPGHMSKPLVLRETDVERETWSDSRGRVGSRTIFGGVDIPGDFTAGVADLDAGGWLGHHSHEPAEIYYVRNGEGALTIDGEEGAHAAHDAGRDLDSEPLPPSSSTQRAGAPARSRPRAY